MASVTITVNADTGNIWTSGTYASIDEGFSPPNDADFISTSTSNDSGFFNLEDMPVDLDEVTGITIRLRGKRSVLKGDPHGLHSVQIFQQNATTPLTTEFVQNVAATTFTTYEVTPTLNGAVDRTTWQNAKIRFLTNGGGDGNVQISAVEFDITYTETGPETYNETATGGTQSAGSAPHFAIAMETATGGIESAGEAVVASFIAARGGLTTGGTAVIGPIVYNTIQPNANANALWSTNTYTTVTAADGTAAIANFTDDGKEQIYHYESLTDAYSPTSVEVFISSKYVGSGSPLPITIRAKIGGVWTASQTVTPANGSYSLSSLVFSGSWTKSNFDDFQTGMKVATIGSGETYSVDFLSAKVRGKTLIVHNEVPTGGATLNGYSTGVFADPSGGIVASGTAVVSLVQQTTATGGAESSGLIKSGFSDGDFIGNYLHDSFWDNETNNNLENHSMDVGDGWTSIAGTWLISSEKATSSTTGTNLIVTDAGVANFGITVDLNFASINSGKAGVIFRYFDSSNFWKIEVSPTANSFKIIEVTGGIAAQRSFSLISIATGQSYSLRVFASSNLIIAEIANVVLTVTDADTFLTSTDVGLFLETTEVSTTSFDNFSATVPVHQVATSGGTRVAGLSTVTVIYNSLTTGGAVVEGEAYAPPIHDVFTFGGITVGGSATLFVDGGAILASEATVTPQTDIIFAGVATLSSEATIDADGFIASASTATLSGEATLLATGGLQQNGNAEIQSVATMSPIGTTTTGATSSLTSTATMTAVARLFKGINTTLAVDSTIVADASADYVETSTGGTATGGTASLSVAYNHSTTGGIEAGGESLLQLNWHPSLTFAAESVLIANATRLILSNGGVTSGGSAVVSYLSNNFCTLSGISDVIATPNRIKKASITLSTAATMTPNGRLFKGSGVVVSCDSSISATPTRFRDAIATLNASSLLNSSPNVSYLGESTLNCASTVTAEPNRIKKASILLSSTASFEPISSPIFGGLASISSVGTLISVANINASGAATLNADATMSASGVVSYSGTSTLTCNCTVDAVLRAIPRGLILELFSYLQSQSTITDLVSTRIYPVRLPQTATLPCIRVQRVSISHLHDMDGSTGLCTARVQFDVLAETYSESKSIAEALRRVMEGFSDDMGTVDVFNSEIDGMVDLYDSPKDGSDNGTYHRAVDYLILHNEKTQLIA